jgi:hypothetical protein
MASLLPFASRVEAAAEAYRSVQGFADKQEWKAKFRVEMVSTHLYGIFSASFRSPFV